MSKSFKLFLEINQHLKDFQANEEVVKPCPRGGVPSVLAGRRSKQPAAASGVDAKNSGKKGSVLLLSFPGSVSNPF